jgi:dipeptidyl aminopeptidase/acylaminoacyl peptidase
MQVAPSGAWRSPLTAERIAAGALRLARPRVDRGHVHWLEGRPAEGGRQVLMRARPGGVAAECTPPGSDVRSRVHEYGGGEYLVRGEALFCVEGSDPRVHRVSRGSLEPLTAARPGSCYADLALSPDGRWLVAVEERPRPDALPENRLVALPVAGGPERVVCDRFDFVSSPRFSADGRRLAFTAWDHPAMPWDASVLWVQGFSPDGPAGSPRRVAGGEGESVFQPEFSPAGRLTFVSDRSGFWNLYQERESGLAPLCPRRAEFGRAQWALGTTSYGFVDEGRILCVFTEEGRDRIGLLALASGQLATLDLPLSAVDDVHVEGGLAAFVAAGPERPPALYALHVEERRLEPLRESLALALEPGGISRPESLEYPTEGGERAHAFLYRPRNTGFAGPAGEPPPLLVAVHGGPTAHARPALDPGVQYWTQRGFALLDVNHGGSTGYGRAFRERLRGGWGVVDVADCANAALHVCAQGLAHPGRRAIRGGSAGGYTALCALATRDVFQAGASRYGIADLEALARETHKFEAHYLDTLVGPYPQAHELYRARSPLHRADGIRSPVLFLQGLEDPVVPPSQAEVMLAALRRRGVPHAYVAFAGERHGFRRAESLRVALEVELAFYGFVFGFDPGVRPEALRIECAPASGEA